MLNIPASTSTPAVLWDEASVTLLISGESYPENSFAFFGPVFSWLAESLPSLARIRLKISVSYMNSSSTKCMLDIIDLLVEAAERGCDASISWLYEGDNDRARELAEEFREDLSIPFEILAVEAAGA